MAEYTLSDFNQDLARKGASVGYMDGNNKIHIATEVEFYISRKSNFIGFVKFVNEVYDFLFDGSFYIGDIKQYLKIVSSTITKTTGTKLVRETSSDGTSNARPFPRYGIATASETGGTEESGKEEEIFSIATLQPREEVAASCLQAMLQKYENPLNIDNTKIKQLVSKSYLFAQEFINQAVLYREKETTSATVENNKYASVDSDSLSSDTDKLLYNIATAINNFIAQDKNQYADQQKNGLKLAATDINVNSLPDNISVKVNGSVTTKQECTSSGT
jgi:hypothetical protein|uniref:Uncharacterized protein n=1 Tax=Podoviridae sp. ctKmJ5 TaxID=2827732 RepID=A0A8S5SY82_9CAUD|nr:MAG TPA: hypothetical protein [Podoviridae sp. ctKmJ5]